MRLFIEILMVLLVTVVLPVVIAHLKERKEERAYQKKELEKQRKIEARKEWEESIIEGKLSLYGDFEARTRGMYVTRNFLYLDEVEAKSLQVYCNKSHLWKNAILSDKFIPLLKVEERPLGVHIVINPIYGSTKVRFWRSDTVIKTIILTRKY